MIAALVVSFAIGLLPALYVVIMAMHRTRTVYVYRPRPYTDHDGIVRCGYCRRAWSPRGLCACGLDRQAYI